MKIILTNDDGFDHLGIKALFMELNKKHEVFNRSRSKQKRFQQRHHFFDTFKAQKVCR